MVRENRWSNRRRWRGSLRRDPLYAILVLVVGAIGLRLHAPIDALGFILAGALLLAAFGRPLLQLALDGKPSPRIDVNLAYLGVAVMVAAGSIALTFAPQARMQLASEASAQTAPKSSFVCQVAYVHDGDTLRCTDGTRVRLHAVAARELDETCTQGHPCPAASAAAAKRELAVLADGDRLICEQTGTSYNRVTAICRNSHGVEINCGMVRSGTAVVWPKFNRERAICRA